MKVKLKAKYATDDMGKPIENRLVTVASFREASNVVCGFIAVHDLTAGCNPRSNAFLGGDVTNDHGEKIAKVSYNGRVWDLDGKEIT